MLTYSHILFINNACPSPRGHRQDLQTGARKMADLKMTDQIVRKMGKMKLVDLKMADQILTFLKV